MSLSSFFSSLQFDTLDVTVQEEFEKFLQERGINDSLAMFIPEFAEYKEQKVGAIFTRRKKKIQHDPRPGIRWLAPERQVVH